MAIRAPDGANKKTPPSYYREGGQRFEQTHSMRLSETANIFHGQPQSAVEAHHKKTDLNHIDLCHNCER